MSHKTADEWRSELVAEGAIFFPDTTGGEWNKINESFAGYFIAQKGSPGEAEVKRSATGWQKRCERMAGLSGSSHDQSWKEAILSSILSGTDEEKRARGGKKYLC